MGNKQASKSPDTGTGTAIAGAGAGAGAGEKKQVSEDDWLTVKSLWSVLFLLPPVVLLCLLRLLA
jgi:hypothetical protein